MTGPDRCPNCGTERPDGLCPKCMLLGVLNADDSALDTTPPPGVLETLALTGGPMPRVLLRDTENFNGPGPVVRLSSDQMPDPSERAGRLQLLGEIARGGMGAVLKGRDNDLGRDLAVKVLLERHGDNPDLVRRFVEEAQIAGQLQHPGVVPIYELGTFADRRPYFAMKLVKGRTLAEILAERSDPALDRPRLLDIFRDVCQTIAYTHARGVIHRDLKPSNVMVGSFGEVQVMDWGLAKVLPRGGATDDERAGKLEDHQTVIATARSGERDFDLSLAGSVMGTPAYMAPEQARGEPVDERSDVFALGSILCEILTGRPAFSGRTTGEIQRKAARADTTDALARLYSCGADAELLALALDCLAGEAEDRPRDAGAVVDRLTGYLAGVQARVQAAERERAVAQAHAIDERRRRKLQAALAGSVLVIALTVGGGWAWLQRQTAERQARTSRQVDVALQEATMLWGRARTAPVGDLASWGEALGAAKRASALLASGEGDSELERRVRTTLTDLTREHDAAREKADATARDRRLVERLGEIRARLGDRMDRDQAEVDFSSVFLEAGLDVDGSPPGEVGARIAASSRAVELTEALDEWTFSRLEADPTNPARARRLIEVAKVADPDPWRNDLRDAIDSQNLQELRRLAASVNTSTIPVESAKRLGHKLKSLGDPEAAVSLLLPVQRLHPGEFWLNFDLAFDYLTLSPPRPAEALRYFTASVAIRPQAGFGHIWLGRTLQRLGRIDEAIAEFKESIRLQPEFAETHFYLGMILLQQKNREEALGPFREAVRLDGDHLGAAIWTLGDLMLDLERPDEAIAVYRRARQIGRANPANVATADAKIAAAELRKSGKDRTESLIAQLREAIRLKPGDALAHNNLGWNLASQGKTDEAIAEYREAIRLNPNYAVAHNNLGGTLKDLGRADEAIVEYREAIRLKPDYTVVHYFLGVSLARLGRREDAVAAFREAVRLDGEKLGGAIWMLGDLLLDLERPDEAIAVYRRARELGRANPTEVSRADAKIAAAERRKAFLGRLDAVLRGEGRARDSAEALAFAALSAARGQHANAVRFYAEAFATDPSFADNPTAVHRYKAACSAARAGGEMDQDVLPSDEATRATLRGQALVWLKADLAILGAGSTKARDDARKKLTNWKADPDLAGVRDADALAKLPEAERREWQALWAEVDALIARAKP